MTRTHLRTLALPLAATLLLAACGGSDSTGSDADIGATSAPAPATTPTDDGATSTDPEVAADSPATGVDDGAEDVAAEPASVGSSSTFEIEVWADNWMAVYVDGVLIGEDSVPITTERSFNAEAFTFDASTPFTLAIEAKDFKETDSGIEYIGEPNQQMGDGGIIAQVTDLSTGEIVTATDANWATLVVHQAPLNAECVADADPDSTCEFLIVDTPSDWTSASFDDSGWAKATEWSAADVSPKDGYDQIAWDPSAQLIWGTDLEVDNTVLLRSTVS